MPEALEELRHVRRSQRNGQVVRLCAADPLNLSGVVLPGKRVPALRTNSIVFQDGLIVREGDSAVPTTKTEPAAVSSVG